MRAHREAEILHRAILEGVHDPTTLQLLNQALTDRTALLQSDLNRVAQLQALVTAIQGGNRAAIQAAREAVKTATEAVVAKAKTFSEDCRVIREHLQSQPRPERRQPRRDARRHQPVTRPREFQHCKRGKDTSFPRSVS